MEETKQKEPKQKISKSRGKKYQAARSLVDKTKSYQLQDAVELVKKMSYSQFGGSVEAHLVVKEAGSAVTFTFPHSTGKSVRVATVTPELIKEIEAG